MIKLLSMVSEQVAGAVSLDENARNVDLGRANFRGFRRTVSKRVTVAWKRLESECTERDSSKMPRARLSRKAPRPIMRLR